MGDRETELHQFTAELKEFAAIEDAFLAKSFTDRLIIVDVADGYDVPAEVVDQLAEKGFQGAEKVYGDGEGTSFTGKVGDAKRYHFVDIQTRGTHRSYVVE